ncbi:hypothetical protein [Gracilibacillus xinjiangensis]|uniref:Uncharacterized protein n=1 Tax=Gracilibacillus xinjiangensis TaxID=1193282 RepID=A0ABV8WRB8_9BACI
MELLSENKRYALASLITAIVIGFLDWYADYQNFLDAQISGPGFKSWLMMLVLELLCYFVGVVFIFSTIMNMTEKLPTNHFLRFITFHIIGSIVVFIIYKWVPIILFFGITSILGLPIYFFAYYFIKKKQEESVSTSQNDK